VASIITSPTVEQGVVALTYGKVLPPVGTLQVLQGSKFWGASDKMAMPKLWIFEAGIQPG